MQAADRSDEVPELVEVGALVCLSPVVHLRRRDVDKTTVHDLLDPEGVQHASAVASVDITVKDIFLNLHGPACLDEDRASICEPQKRCDGILHAEAKDVVSRGGHLFHRRKSEHPEGRVDEDKTFVDEQEFHLLKIK